MPFKSKAQRNRALELLKTGGIKQITFDEWDRGTPKDLPDRLHEKSKKSKSPLKKKAVYE